MNGEEHTALREFSGLFEPFQPERVRQRFMTHKIKFFCQTKLFEFEFDAKNIEYTKKLSVRESYL